MMSKLTHPIIRTSFLFPQMTKPDYTDLGTNQLLWNYLAKKISYTNLKSKLQSLWQPSESLKLIDLGFDYYLIKFFYIDNYTTALTKGPWFIRSQYLTVQLREPKFNPAIEQTNYSTIWIRLQELPNEY